MQRVGGLRVRGYEVWRTQSLGNSENRRKLSILVGSLPTTEGERQWGMGYDEAREQDRYWDEYKADRADAGDRHKANMTNEGRI